jgi:hypothetical protein
MDIQMICEIQFPPGWINSSKLENALTSHTGPHETQSSETFFCFSSGCKIMIDAAVRLLSLFNQLDYCGRRVRLDFEDGLAGVMGYLNRMGFFDHLSPNVEVLPEKPFYSGAEMFGRTNTSLVEIAQINHQHRDPDLLSRLTSALMQSCRQRADAQELEGAAWTIFAELIDNIFSHSQTPLDGYAALQLYQRGNSLSVAVSDSGLGIMDTLRPALANESPNLAQLSDVDLLVEIFRQGLSRHGADRGCGLKGSAAKAIKFKAQLDVRLPNSMVVLVPSNDGYTPNRAVCYNALPLIWGTHICFNFSLD